MRKFLHAYVATVVAFWSLLLMPMMPAVAAADTCTWTGADFAVNTNWSNGSNWSGCDNGGVPEDGDSLIFPASPSSLTPLDDMTITVNTVTVSGNGYTFDGPTDTDISDVWQFTGANNIVTSNLIITNTSSVSLVVSGGATGNVINGNIALALTGGADMNTDINEDITHNGAITGSADVSFQQTGTGTWITSSVNPSSFTASVNISSGYFQCNNDNCFGANANNVSNNSGGALQFNNGALTIANNITLASSVSPQLNVISGSPSLNGTFTVSPISSGTVYVQGASLTVSGAITLNADLSTNGTDATVSSIYLNGNITGSSTGNVIADNSFLGVSGNNAAYGGDFTAMPGAVLEAFSSDSLGDTVGITTIQSGATLYADSTITVNAEPITVSGTGVGTGNYLGAIVSHLNDRTYTGTITLAGDTKLYASGSGELIIAGPISGAGNLNVESSDASSFVTFDGSVANTYSGTTYVVDGGLQLVKDPGVVAIPGNLVIDGTSGLSQVQINNAEQVANNANINMLESVAFNAQLQTDAETVGSLSGAGSVYIVQNTFNVGGDNTTTAYTGSITTNNIVPGTLNKQGTGAFNLNGTTSVGFEPNFTVSGGVMNVVANYSTSPFSTSGSGVLKGNGQTGVTTINTGGTLAAGTSPGCITSASLTLSSGSNFEEEITGGTVCTQYDQTIVTGNASLGGATLNVIPSYTPTPGTVFTILQAGSISGTFNGLADGATFTANGIQFRINYTSSQVNLTVLGGTLAQTGNNTSLISFAAIGLVFLALGGLAVERITRRRKYAHVK